MVQWLWTDHWRWEVRTTPVQMKSRLAWHPPSPAAVAPTSLPTGDEIHKRLNQPGIILNDSMFVFHDVRSQLVPPRIHVKIQTCHPISDSFSLKIPSTNYYDMMTIFLLCVHSKIEIPQNANSTHFSMHLSIASTCQ